MPFFVFSFFSGEKLHFKTFYHSYAHPLSVNYTFLFLDIVRSLILWLPMLINSSTSPRKSYHISIRLSIKCYCIICGMCILRQPCNSVNIRFGINYHAVLADFKMKVGRFMAFYGSGISHSAYYLIFFYCLSFLYLCFAA